MNKQQIRNMYEKQLDLYLEAIIRLKIQRDVVDFEILEEAKGYRFEFKLRPALDVFVLKVMTVLNHFSAIPVYAIVEENKVELLFSDLNE